MKRILTRKWFWIMVTTALPALWQVLSATPETDAQSQAEGAAQMKAALAVCQHLDAKACHG